MKTKTTRTARAAVQDALIEMQVDADLDHNEYLDWVNQQDEEDMVCRCSDCESSRALGFDGV